MDEVASLVIKVLSEQVETAEKRLQELEGQSRKTEREVKKLGAVSFKNVAGELAAYGFAVVTLQREVSAAVKRWVEFDSAIKTVGSVASLTKKEFQALRKETLLLSAALGVDAKASAEGLYEAFQADIPKGNAIEFLGTATKTAIGGLTSTTSAVNALTNVINAYGLDVGRSEEISDKLFTTVLYGKASFDQLGASLSGATVPAAAMGVKFEEVLAMITQITSQGTSTSEAITQIERSIQSLINPSEEMVAVFKQLGVEGGRQAIAQFGLVGTLERVRQAYAGNDAALVKATGSVIALQAVLGTTGSKLERTEKAFDQVTNSAGATERAFKANSDTVASSLNAIKSSVTLLIEQLEGSLGVIKAFSEGLRGAVLLAQQAASIMDNTNFSAGTNQALNTAKSGGANGALALKKQIEELEQKRKVLNVGWERGDVLTSAGEANGGFDLFGMGGRSLLSRALEKNKKEIETLQSQYNQIDDITKATANSIRDSQDIQYDVNTGSVLPEKGAIAQAKLNDELDQQIAKQSTISKWQAANENEAKLRADAEDKRAADLLKLSEKQAKIDEKNKQEMIKVSGLATDLSKTEIEKLREKQDLIRKGMASKDEESRIDQLVGEKAIANLDEQIKLIGERDAKKAEGGGGGGGATANAFKLDGLPEISDPFGSKNIFDQLRDEEKEIADSYRRRREAILAETELTENDRLALLGEASKNYQAIMAKADQERFNLSLETASNFFGDLAQVSAVFGKKGAAMAKGFAVAQATVDMFSSAVAAYKATIGIPYVGPVVAPTAAAGALAFGAMNIAKIKSTDYAGAFEHGGMVPAGKFGVVGEAGPELVHGPAVVTSARTTAQSPTAPASAPKTTVTVHNYTGGTVEEKRTQTSEGELVDIILRRAKKEVADDIRKGGTAIASSVEQSYGLRRKGR
jgi:TP901 family phage tail tape measure protein